MKSQPVLLPKAMSVSVAMQQQASVLISMARITTKDHVNFPGLGDHRDIQELYRSGLPLILCSILESWSDLLPASALGRAGPSRSGVEPLQQHEHGRAGPTIHLL